MNMMKPVMNGLIFTRWLFSVSPSFGELKDLEATNSFLRLYSASHLAMFSMYAFTSATA